MGLRSVSGYDSDLFSRFEFFRVMERRCFLDIVDEFSDTFALGIDGIFRCMCAGAPPSITIDYLKCDQHDVTPLLNWSIGLVRDKVDDNWVITSGIILLPGVGLIMSAGSSDCIVLFLQA